MKLKDESVNVVVSGPERGLEGMLAPSIQHDINHVEGMAGIEESLDWIARGLDFLTSQDHTVNLTLGQGDNTYPVKVTFADNDIDNTMGRLVTAFERIADSLARIAGMSRPRLEDWHHPDEYMPSCREITAEGAPGPSAKTTERLNRYNATKKE